MQTTTDNDHLLRPGRPGIHDMRSFYADCGMLATSTNADIALIRSHIAYWSGHNEADRAVIKPSRGHSYRVNKDVIVRIVDHYDHREGVTGWN